MGYSWAKHIKASFMCLIFFYLYIRFGRTEGPGVMVKRFMKEAAGTQRWQRVSFNRDGMAASVWSEWTCQHLWECGVFILTWTRFLFITSMCRVLVENFIPNLKLLLPSKAVEYLLGIKPKCERVKFNFIQKCAQQSQETGGPEVFSLMFPLIWSGFERELQQHVGFDNKFHLSRHQRSLTRERLHTLVIGSNLSTACWPENLPGFPLLTCPRWRQTVEMIEGLIKWDATSSLLNIALRRNYFY